MKILKTTVEKYIRHSKNPSFSFDESMSSGLLISFIFLKVISLIRGLRVLTLNRRPSRVFLGHSVSLFNKRRIFWGNNVSVGDFVKFSALGKKGIFIGDNVTIGSFCQVVVSMTLNDLGEFIDVGDNVGIGEFSYLGGAGGLTIGDDTIIGQYFSSHPENHIYSNPNTLIRNQGVSRKGINVGSNCWIGAKVTILDGVNIGDNCVIAAGTVVNRSFKSNMLIGGVPAKVIRELS